MLIYLCEDSESDALRLKHHLNTYATKHHCNMEILLFSSGEEMLQHYKEEKRYPALLFLDIFHALFSILSAGLSASKSVRENRR